MALTPSFVRRTADPSGTQIVTFDDPGGDKVQGMVITDDSGDQTAIQNLPLATKTPACFIISSPFFHRGFAFGPGNVKLYDLRVIMDPTLLTDLYIQFFDDPAAGLPTTPPIWSGLLPLAGELSAEFRGSFQFPTGFKIFVSSTPDVYTDPGPSVAYNMLVT